MKTLKTDYHNCLTNLTNSLLKHYGLKTYHTTLKELDDILEEKHYKNIVLMLYDGMGANLLKRNLPKEAFLNKKTIKNIHAVFPPTTTASTTSVLSGLNPNEHGWLGWDLYFPKIDKVVTMFTNNIKDTTISCQKNNISEETYPFDRLPKVIGEKVNAVALFPFRDTIYTDIDDMHQKIIDICNNDQENFIYAYYEDPDHTQHLTGTDSDDTKKVYEMLNKKTEQLCSNLKDSLVIIIADHGHMNSSPITLSEYKDIFECLERDISIESRACSFKIKEENKKEFEKLFKENFSKDFHLYTKQEVLDNKLFGEGENNPFFEESLGDFLAVAINNKYFRYNEKGKSYKSMHGGATEDEVLVPLIIGKK